MTDMQKIDFHYNVPDRLRYACLVARTVYRRGLTLAVWTADERRLRELDSLLWRFDDLAFLPHVRAGSPLAGETPIRLSSRLEELEGDVLLLLDDQLPPVSHTPKYAFRCIRRTLMLFSPSDART